MERISAILLEFCRQRDFFNESGDIGKESSRKVDTVREFSQDLKRVSNDLVFVEKADELLKEAVLVLKKCDQSYQTTVIEQLVDSLSLQKK